MVNVRIDRLVLALTDEELEVFVREWVSNKTQYLEVKRFTGTGDKGRDVVGFLTEQRHEGAWHNYQCKQYGRNLPTGTAMLELGKMFYYSFIGEFTLPTQYYFVAPRGVNRVLKNYLSNPTKFYTDFLSGWDKYCASKISQGTTIELSSDLNAHIQQWNFSNIDFLSVDEILDDESSKPVLKKWFDIDPGPAPDGVVPEKISQDELPYIGELLNAYGEREGLKIGFVDIEKYSDHNDHLKMQRERFFDADAFFRFYRDNTMHEDLEHLRKDMQHGVAETHRADYADSLERAYAVLKQAAVVNPSGKLAQHARVSVKQGTCHHFVNEGKLKWRRN